MQVNLQAEGSSDTDGYMLRRTGITLKEGQRDEHGMEAVDGLFSSPEKSPAKLNEFDDEEEEEFTGSEGMSIEEGGLTSLGRSDNPNSSTDLIDSRQRA